MKLKIKNIQFLDMIFKYLVYSKKLNTNIANLNLVIKIDGQLWSGDFVLFKEGKIFNPYIDYDNDIIHDYKYISHYTPIDLNLSKYEKLKPTEIYLLLNDLISLSKNLDLKNIDLLPILHNATNLTTRCNFNFIQLDNESDYEVVSLVESLKDVYTHS